jgi:hypothetical protein
MGSFKDKVSTSVGNGGKRPYFKAADHKDAYVLLIEPKKAVENARNPFYDEKDERSKPTRLEVTADVTIFSTLDHLEAGSATFLSDIVFTDLYLALDLKEEVPDGIVVARLNQRPNTKGRPSWVFRAAEGQVMDLVEKFYDAREAALDAAADELPEV